MCLRLGGRWASALFNASQKYGEVVRIAPNELFFSTNEAFEEIFGHANHKKNRKPFLKSNFYDNPDEMSPLGAERDPVRHATTRKQLAHSFSESALTQQVPIITGHVNRLMDQLSKHGAVKEGINVDDVSLHLCFPPTVRFPSHPNSFQWFSWLTFDIIGDLAFGKSFHALEERTTPAL